MDLPKLTPPKIPQKPSTVRQIVFDLDGTLATSTWPRRYIIGEPIKEVVSLLRTYAAKGWGICVYTSRPENDKQRIWEWLEGNNIPVDKVVCNKPQASLYIDDKAWNPWRQYDSDDG